MLQPHIRRRRRSRPQEASHFARQEEALEEARQPGGSVHDEAAEHVAAVAELPLEQVAHKAHGKAQVLQEQADPVPNDLGGDPAPALRGRLERPAVERVVGPEDPSVPGLQRIGRTDGGELSSSVSTRAEKR